MGITFIGNPYGSGVLSDSCHGFKCTSNTCTKVGCTTFKCTSHECADRASDTGIGDSDDDW